VLVFGLAQEIDSKSKLKFNVFPKILDIPIDHNYFDTLILGNILPAPSVTVRTSAIRDVGGYDNTYMIEDYPLWLKFSRKGLKFAVNPSISSYYRIHRDNISKKLDMKKQDILILLKYIDYKSVKNVVDTRLLNIGIYNRNQYLELIHEYKKITKLDFNMKFVGLPLPGRLKKWILFF
jgi:alpha-1,3-rhamnosyltransferase